MQGCRLSESRLQERSGAVDTRTVQALQPLITLTELHKKLAVNSPPEQQVNQQQLYSGSPSKLGEAAKQAALTAAILPSNSGSSDVPDGLTAETWADLQKTAKELDVRGIFDPQTNQLRSRMLQQVKLYKATQAKQLQETAAKAGFGSASGKQTATAAIQQSAAASLAGRLEASCQQVIASLPVKQVKAHHKAASVISAQSGLTYHTNRTGRTGRMTHQQLGEGLQDWSATIEASSPQHQQHLTPILQLQRPNTPGQDEHTSVSGPAETARSLALGAAALAGLSARTSNTADAVTAWQQHNEALAESNTGQGVCSCGSNSVHMQQQLRGLRHSPGGVSTLSSARNGDPSTGFTQRTARQPTVEVIEEERQSPKAVRGTTSTFQHRRTMPRKQDKSLAECVAAIDSQDRPSSPADQAADTTAAAVQRRLTPAACEAFQAAVATAVDTKLKLYRDRAQQARQELLQRELAVDAVQQPQKQKPLDTGDSASAAGDQTANAGSNSTKGPAAGAALLTMQQIVALLAKRDGAPLQDETPTNEDPSAGSAAIVPSASIQPAQETAPTIASQKLAAARSVADIIAAADEQMTAAAQEYKDMVKAHARRATTQNAAPAAGELAEKHWQHDTHGVARASIDISSSSSINTAEASQISRAVSATSSASNPAAGNPASRAPAGMRLPPPRLQAPTAQELEALPLPSLPQLLDLSHDPAKVLQARLERVWGVLGMTPQQQLDMVLRYTSRAAVSQFEAALEAWEITTAAVLQREGILKELTQLRAAMQQERQQQQQRTAGLHRRTLEDAPKLLLGLDVHEVHQLLWAFLAATEQVRYAVQQLQDLTGQQLMVNQVAYPPPGAVSSASQLQPILDEVWDVLGCGVC